MTTAARLFHTIKAKSRGERIAHRVTRVGFLRCVVKDERTRNLFSWWGQQCGLDDAVETLGQALDIVVRGRGLPNRLAVRTQSDLSPALHRQLLELHQRVAALLDETRAHRTADILPFVTTVLYHTHPPDPLKLAWLSDDLMTIFDGELVGHAWGTTVGIDVPLAPTATHVVPPGQTPKGEGEHLVRNAEWYYRHVVKDPQDPPVLIATEYREARERAGVTLAGKDGLGDVRADTKLVRRSIAEAERLLMLNVPLGEWLRSHLLDAPQVKGEKH